MSSPNATLRHATSSETNLSSKSHVISPASSPATIPSSSKVSSSSSPNPTLTKVKLRRKGIYLRAYDHEINNSEPSSPYYMGLLYTPIDINDEYGSQNHHHHHQNNLNSSGGGGPNNSNSRVPATTNSEAPYYRGLTNFSLDIIHHGGQDSWRNIHEVEGAYECSPYFRGLLTDSYLAMAIRKLEGGGGLCLGGKDEMTDLDRQHTLSALSPPAPIPLPSPSLPLSPPPLMSMFPSKGKTALSMEPKVEDGGKALGERESEESEEEKVVEIDENNKEEAMNESAGLPKEEVNKEKSLRESVSNNISEQTVSSASSSSESSSNKDVPHQEIKDDEDEGEGSLIKEYVWANKYQPKALKEFICHKHIVSQLLTMIKEGCVCDHFIFEGPPGVGKRTMIRALLREVFGHDQVKVTEEDRTFLLKGEVIGSIQVPIIKSEHHIEVNLSRTKGNENHVVADLLRETYDKIISTSIMPCDPKDCQAIIIYEAETLSRESLLYIKWMVERYNKGCNKVFFCCSDESKLQTVKPICKTFRLSPPSTQEIVEVLEYIGKVEGKELSLQLLTKVVEKSKNNLRQAIRSLEATCHNKGEYMRLKHLVARTHHSVMRDSIKEDELILTGWEDDISNIAKNILKEQSSKQLYRIHVKLQTLMIHKVSPDFVYKCLVSEIKSLVDESLKAGLEKLEKEYNHKVYGIKMRSGKHSGHAHNKERESDEKNNERTKKINARNYSEVEEFIAKVMSWYKTSSSKVVICK